MKFLTSIVFVLFVIALPLKADEPKQRTHQIQPQKRRVAERSTKKSDLAEQLSEISLDRLLEITQRELKKDLKRRTKVIETVKTADKQSLGALIANHLVATNSKSRIETFQQEIENRLETLMKSHEGDEVKEIKKKWAELRAKEKKINKRIDQIKQMAQDQDLQPFYIATAINTLVEDRRDLFRGKKYQSLRKETDAFLEKHEVQAKKMMAYLKDIKISRNTWTELSDMTAQSLWESEQKFIGQPPLLRNLLPPVPMK